MILNPRHDKTKTIKNNASSTSAERLCVPASPHDAEHVCVPVITGGSTNANLGELGWEYPCIPTDSVMHAINTLPAEQLSAGRELATDANHGNIPDASDERVKVSPSSARPRPLGIGDLTAHAVREGTGTNDSAPRNNLCEQNSCNYINTGMQQHTHTDNHTLATYRWLISQDPHTAV